MNKILIILSAIILSGCSVNNAKIPAEGKIMRDFDDKEYFVKFNIGNTYFIDVLPSREKTNE